ncbi:6,7-dimethyl-8-ribityllumazine synthase [Chelativorans sp. AA-79]|uniref:6,7-dimethyl-8-ribityllumazine synthase n=1 Tax=Chelativorans sp. AA-79 TaxID=3028735 RepID=UPI0023F80053|nr:6,7-dimethyl-8-ribityllumazine synthase [Chelativorans sp. AA-79]WEX07461.1 6,7-dimethyl-8-ribityllumazine synthase [Chelativorans sp. AA-79]
MTDRKKLLIVEARFYDDLADGLLESAREALDEAGADYDVVTVPGALEIPGAIAQAHGAARKGGVAYDGYVALGCVIRGETYHFEIVSNESARGLMDLTVREGLAIGNGILTVENEEQAWVRVRGQEETGTVESAGKGRGAADAALRMIELKKRLGA